MKKMSCLVLPAILVISSAGAYPAIGGGRGLFRMQNALVESEAGLTVSLCALGRHPNFPGSDRKGWIADLIAPELSYAPLATKYLGLELFGSWGGVFQFPKDTTEIKLDMGLHDLRAGAKLSFPLLPVLKLGFTSSYTFPPGDRTTRGWLDPEALPKATDPAYTWTALATLQLQELAPPVPNLLFNYGKLNRLTNYGFGLELAATDFALSAEVYSQQTDSSTGLFDTRHGTVRITPGVAFGSGSTGGTLKLGYTFAWGPATVNEVMLGIVVATPFGKRIPPQFGILAGTVTDSRTGLPLAAKVSFPENPSLKPLITDSTTGVFQVKKVPAGAVLVEVVAEGYHTQAIPIEVKPGVLTQHQFVMKPRITYGVIAGTVMDANTGKPLAAKVEFPGSDLQPATSDPATGSFRLDNVPVGIYNIVVSCDGYFQSSLTVQVEENKIATPQFSLRPLAAKSTFTGKVSSKKTGSPLAATISFPGSDLPEISTDPATGVFTAELPVGSYAVKVSSEGYIDQTAAVVLVEGQPLVRDFELVKAGEAITLRGIYFEVNKATIRPESYPALAEAAKILQDNPDIKVEIQGHTDSDGPEDYNLQLSERRAQAVLTYLVQNFAIDPARMIAKGYGESQPVASNATPEGKALNRRTVFVILK